MGKKRKMVEPIVLLFFAIIRPKFINYISEKALKFFHLCYGYYLKGLLKKIGTNFNFEYPVILKGGEFIEIGNEFTSLANFRIEAWDKFHNNTYTPQIKIGDNVTFNFNCHLGGINRIEIGDNVLIGSNVLITDHSHGETSREALSLIPSERPLFSKGGVFIDNGVWIGENVSILANVHIGENAIIGANSVVTSNLPRNCIAGGIPARVIKQF